MSDSIYAPPEADVQTPDTETSDYYVVSPLKFYVLSIITATLYFVYWFYRNWRFIKMRDGSDSWPPMRALFYIFFTHSLFVDVNETIKTQERTYQWQPGMIAGLFVVTTIVTNILDRMSWNNVGTPTTDVAGVSLMFVSSWLLLQGQRAINFACGDPEGKTNNSFTPANWIWLIIGGLWWLLILAGLYFMVTDPGYLAE